MLTLRVTIDQTVKAIAELKAKGKKKREARALAKHSAKKQKMENKTTDIWARQIKYVVSDDYSDISSADEGKFRYSDIKLI